MNVIVVGCGRVGAELAYNLYQGKHQITVIDEQSSAFDELPADFRGRIVEGEVLSPDVLRRAGIETAHGLAAVTSSDSLNAVVAHLARTVYHIPNVVVRSYSTRQRALLECFGLQIVSPSTWGAHRIEELLTGVTTEAVFSAGNGEVEVYQFMAPGAWANRPVHELEAEGLRMVMAVVRAGRAFLPVRDTKLTPGDVVHVSATTEGITALQQQLHLAGG
jgi:trk system potassium uptake protein